MEARINVLKCRYEKFYIVPDYETEQDGKQIAEVFKDLPILTGGSGLLAYVLQSNALLHSKKKSAPKTRTDYFAMWKLFGCY